MKGGTELPGKSPEWEKGMADFRCAQNYNSARLLRGYRVPAANLNTARALTHFMLTPTF